MDYRRYRVSRRDKEPLLGFVLEALRQCGCRVLQASDPVEAPFRITFETEAGERLGILLYAFFANSQLTKNRPADKHRFQVKYGPDDKQLHALWQDPFSLYTTLFCGIDPERGFFVGADPVLHSPTRFFISVEFKAQHVDEVLRRGWCYVRFEREAFGEDQGHRQLLAEKAAAASWPFTSDPLGSAAEPTRLHALAEEFQMRESEVLDLIAGACAAEDGRPRMGR